MARETEIEARVEGLLAAPLAGLGFQLLEARYVYEGRWVLRLVIDREQGIGLDDCGAVSELASRILEVEDPVPNAFSLEVSSPGLFRPLSRPLHFRQSVGKLVRLILVPGTMDEERAGPAEAGGQTPAGEQRKENRRKARAETLRGRIVAVKEETLSLEAGGETLEVPMEAIRKARLDPDL